MNITLIEREEELFRLWQSLPAPGCTFRCIRGERIVVIAHGDLNTGPGPDFRDAVLLIDGRLRVGNVEMHLQEADWFTHGHTNDPAYDSVILHVLAHEPAPERIRLSIPTISARMFAEVSSPVEIEEEKVGQEAEAAEAFALLAELAWQRLLRRVTEILRQQSDGAAGEWPQEEDVLRHAFLVRLFDSLGYSRNRAPMKRVAQVLSATVFAPGFRGAAIDFDAVAQMIFAVAGIPSERLERVAREWMPEGRLQKILPVADLQGESGEAVGWDYRGRPANAPERRLWGGAKLTFDFLRGLLLENGLEGMRRRVPFNTLIRPFVVRLGGEVILGRPRAAEILLNVLCPVALACGILRKDPLLIEGACLTYRNAPSLASNRLVREVERRFTGKKLNGAFLQQGAIEYYQRVLSPDRSNYSMIAEPGGGEDV